MTNNTPETKDIPSSSVRPFMEIEWTARGWTQRGTIGGTRSTRVGDTKHVRVTSMESTDTWVTLPEMVTWLNPTTVELVPGSLGVGVTTTGETIRGYVVRGGLRDAPLYVRTISPTWGYLKGRYHAEALQSWTQLYPYPEEPVSSWDRWEDVPLMTPVVASEGSLKHLAYRKNREGRVEVFDGNLWRYSRTYLTGGPREAHGTFTRTEVDPTTGNPLP